MRVDQVLVGLAITIFGGGSDRVPLPGHLRRAESLPQRRHAAPGDPVVERIPIVGDALFNQGLLFYLAFALVPVFAFLLARTRFGLQVRAVGEHPFAADAAGVDVTRTRYIAALIAGTMAGLAGAFLSVADLKIFQVGMTVGMGFIALALTMVGGWNPYRILLASVLFGLLRSLGNGLQILGVDVRTEFITMLPYIGIMVALALLPDERRSRRPSGCRMPAAVAELHRA